MSKPEARAYSAYAREAIALLGQLVRAARLSRRLTMDEVAERAGITRALLRRIERGEMGSAIGAAFEVAAIVGVRLFDADQDRLGAERMAQDRILSLMPASARRHQRIVDDDF